MIKVIISDDRLRYNEVQPPKTSSNFNITKFNFKLKDMFGNVEYPSSTKNKSGTIDMFSQTMMPKSDYNSK